MPGLRGQPVLHEDSEVLETLLLPPSAPVPAVPHPSRAYAIPCSFFKGGGLATAGLGEKGGWGKDS